MSLLAVSILRIGDTRRGFIEFSDNQVFICKADNNAQTVPAINDPSCQKMMSHDINPHHRQIWVLGKISDPRPFLENGTPIGLYVSAKASSTIYLNGKRMGQNGKPGFDRKHEIEGQLDNSLYVPRRWLNDGDNEIAILMSGHHSVIPSASSILTIAFGEYRAPPFHGGTRYWISTLTFGAFLIGAIYFGTTALLGYEKWLSITLSLASLFAALQLLSEVTRGLWAYPYSFHDIRLILISTFSAGVGLVLAIHSFKRFEVNHGYKIIFMCLAIMFIGLFVIPSFDGRATWMMFVPIAAASIVSLSALKSHGKIAPRYALAFISFAALILINPRQFLDMFYYITLAALFIYFFIQQAFDIRAAIRNQEKAEASRSQLEAALEKISNPAPRYLVVNSAGRQERLDMYDILVLSRAEDYVSIRMKDGREILHRASLKTLQKKLPACFIIVHRSHIINANFVVNLKRLASGVGELSLVDNFSVPVSRRVMPQLRKSLSSATL
ncbi:MAG: LytTR family DNA-binding domain-containing protein [Hellea sp.]